MDLTIISGSNRPANRTRDVAGFYQQILLQKGHKAGLLDLQSVDSMSIVEAATGKRVEAVHRLQSQYIQSVSKIIVVVPEYNGSVPGFFKLFVDAIAQEQWLGKKVALVGISAGRSGNSRGLDHLTGVFHYLNVEVMSYKLNIPFVRNLLDDGIESDPFLAQRINKQILLLEQY